MNYGLISTPTLKTSDCLVIGLFSDHILPEFAAAIDKKYDGLLGRLVKKLKEKGDIVWQSDVDDSSLMIIDCGDAAQFSAENLKKRLTDITACLLK